MMLPAAQAAGYLYLWVLILSKQASGS